jgi:hypothetical protein
MRQDQGQDYQGSAGGQVLALGNARVDAIKPDPGGFGTALYYTLVGGPNAGQQFYVGHAQPTVKVGQMLKPGQPIARLVSPGLGPSPSYWTEIGFAKGGVPEYGMDQGGAKFDAYLKGLPGIQPYKPPSVVPPGTSAYTPLKAAQIDTFLKARNSPLAGMGAAFVAAGAKYGVDPGVLVAISGGESSFGQKLFRPFNPFGYGKQAFPSFQAAINRVASDLGTNYNLSSISSIGSRYSPPASNPNWVPNVLNFYQALTGHPYGHGTVPTATDYSTPNGSGAPAGGGVTPAGAAGFTVTAVPPGQGVGGTDTAATAAPQTVYVGPTLTSRTRDPLGGEAPILSPQPKVTAAPAAGSPGVAATGPAVGGIDIPSIIAQVNQQSLEAAKAAIAAQVTGFTNAQQFETGLGQQQAAAIAGMADAAAKYLQPFGALANQQYQEGVASEQNLAQGFSGAAAQDVSDRAAQMNRDLQAAGSPIGVPDQGQTLGGVLMGTTGAIPSRLLGVQGGAATAAALNQPFSAIAQGEAGQTAAQGAAIEKARAYQGQILAAQAQLPTLYNQFRTASLGSAIQLAALQKPIVTRTPSGIALVNPITGAVTIPPNVGNARISPQISKSTGWWTDIFGTKIVDSKGNYIPYPTGGAGVVPGGITKVGNALVRINPDYSTTVLYQGPSSGNRISSGGNVYEENPNKPGQWTQIIKAGDKPAQLIHDSRTGYTATFNPSTASLTVIDPGTGPASMQPQVRNNANGVPVVVYPVQNKNGTISWSSVTPSGPAGAAKVTTPRNAQTGTTVVRGITYQTERQPDGSWAISVAPNGQPIVVKGPKAAGGLTGSGIGSVTARAFAAIKAAAANIAPLKGAAGQVTNAGHSPEPYQATLQNAINMYPSPNPPKWWVNKVTQRTNNAYRTYVNGLATAFQKGTSDTPAQDSVTTFRALNAEGFPPAMVLNAVLSAYGISRAQLQRQLNLSTNPFANAITSGVVGPTAQPPAAGTAAAFRPTGRFAVDLVQAIQSAKQGDRGAQAWLTARGQTW